MHLKICLPYVLLATHIKPFLASEHGGRGPTLFLVCCRKKKERSGSGASDVWVAEG